MGDLQRYLEVLAGDRPDGRLIEVRYRQPVGMGQRFLPATQITAAARAIRQLGARRDTYVGVVLRDRRSGRRGAVSRSHLLFVELDADASGQLLQRAPRPPTVLIESGTPGHIHAYWCLSRDVSGPEVLQANRKLAYRVGGDLASVDETRILRPPETANFKHDPARAVVLQLLDSSRVYDIDDLLRGLDDPPGLVVGRERRVARRPRSRPPDGDAGELDECLRAIDTAEYVKRLTGREPNREGKIACPFHDLSAGRAAQTDVSPACSVADASLTDRGPFEPASHAASDALRLVPPPVYFERLTGLRVGRSGKLRCLFHEDRTPSLHVYREPGRGWYCFGCGRGGSIYDLAALLSGRGTRGSDFFELQRELEELLLPSIQRPHLQRGSAPELSR